MKLRTTITIALLAFGLTVFARTSRLWTEAEMRTASDLVVVGTVAKMKDLEETSDIAHFPHQFRGVETTFAVSKVLKGNFTNSTVVLHHYRQETNNFLLANGPNLLELTPNSTNQYLLYLVKDGPTRFAPTTGQVDPAMEAVKMLPKK